MYNPYPPRPFKFRLEPRPNYSSSRHIGAFGRLNPSGMRREGRVAVGREVAALPAPTANGTLVHSNQSLPPQPDEIIENESQYLVVYADGACTLNGYPGARAGSGVWFGPEQNRWNIAERCPGSQTDHRAELFALIRALETIDDCNTPILIKTSSEYVINSIRTYLPHWHLAGFKSSSGEGTVPNCRLIRYLSALIDYRRLVLGQPVKLHHVSGHQGGQQGNEAADLLAKVRKVGSLVEQSFEPDWLACANVLESCIECLAVHRELVHPHPGDV